jgi:hypothetical protein
MTERTTAWLLRLYPAAWRERYEEEFRAVLDEYSSGPLIVLDTMRGALDARLHLATLLGRSWSVNSRIRPSLLAVFTAWIAFVIVGLWLNGQVDDSVYGHAMRSGGALHVAYVVLEGGSALSLIAATIGGLPVVWQIWRRSPELRWLLMVPVVCFAAIAAPLGLLVIITANHLVPPNPGPATDGGHWVRDYLVAVFLLGAVASVLAVTRAVLRGHASDRALGLARWAGWALTASMAVMLAATVVWGLLAGNLGANAFHAPGLTNQGSPNVVSWLVVVAVMAVGTVVAALSLWRGGDGSRATPALA